MKEVAMNLLLAMVAFAAVGAGPKPDFTGVFPASVKTIGIVMPASVYDKTKFDQGVEAIKAAGYKVKLAPRLKFAELASPAERAADLVDVWTDADVDLVFCARGGSGVEKIVPYLDWARLRKRPNVFFLGFSDITVLHNAFLKQKVGHPISGPTMSSIPRSTKGTKVWLNRAIAGEAQPPVKLHALKPGAFEGLPCGGHAHRFSVALRMGFSVEPKGKVVFLESECSIGLKRLRETLDYLVDSGSMDGVVGVIFGDMTPGSGMAVNELTGEALVAAKAEVEKMKREFAEKVKCPVYDGLDYGHGNVNLAIDHLRKVSVDVDGIMRW